jgi:competence protein ComFC
VRLVRPPYCSRCGLPFPGAITDEFACANCREVELAFESARAAVVAEGPILEVIHRFKYQRALWFEPFLARLLTQAAVPELAGAGWDFVVPVPLHPVKQRDREFNQAERLARHLATALELSLRTHVVERIAPTLTQTHLTRDERAKNVRKAFRSKGKEKLEGESVIVVDDVFTTGATANAVAQVLRARGAGRVCVWSVARAILGHPPVA